MRPPLTTHVLDTASGRPAAGLQISLSKQVDGAFQAISCAVTNADGRVDGSLAGDHWGEGVYRIRFETEAYFTSQEQSCFYPYAEVVFRIVAPDQHYHVPLLVSPFGYSTYRGS